MFRVRLHTGWLFSVLETGSEERALRSLFLCCGEERALRLSCFMVVQKVPRDAHLHLVRTPPSCNLDALLYGRHWGLSRWCLGPLPSLRDCAASDQGPSHRAATYGVVAARRPPMSQNRPTTHVPQPLLHLVRLLRASRAHNGLSGWCC